MSELSQLIPGNFTLTGSVTVFYFNDNLYRELSYKASYQAVWLQLEMMRPRMRKRAWRRLRGRMIGRLTRR